MDFMKTTAGSVLGAVVIAFIGLGGGMDTTFRSSRADFDRGDGNTERSSSRQFVFDKARQNYSVANAAVQKAANDCAINNGGGTEVGRWVADLYVRRLKPAIIERDNIKADKALERKIYDEVLLKSNNEQAADRSGSAATGFAAQVLNFRYLTQCVFDTAAEELAAL
jgi:hypothetical protein